MSSIITGKKAEHKDKGPRVGSVGGEVLDTLLVVFIFLVK